MAKTILIAGATGMVGKELQKFLSFQNNCMKVRIPDSYARYAIKTKDYRIFDVKVKSKTE